ncbi:hypothetical protein AWC38_SpisGene14690 [Stylophora pistillata]|uniref:Reverse transcriptase domain-containing protein n=1 Tax=Stylophora pistillata TaxID=50429 RepID=A0A2B4RWX6_STYPI|nr:hypothetical protein AWC38_SpisGene14690 [Stylophora pistillata]
MAKTLCTHYIDPSTIEPLVESRLIPLDEGEGALRPIGVGEVIRRICAKCVMNIVKRDVVEATGSLQLCAGQKLGSEAAMHAMHRIFEADDTDLVLLIDASNAFNALNRAAALRNIRVLCPVIAVYARNTYRQFSRLFITGGKEITSVEGTTQVDPLAMGLYALSTQLLIASLQAMLDAKQCWLADDTCGAGTISEIKQWWDGLNAFNPDIGYFPNGKKCRIFAKPEKEALVREAFKETVINVTVEGQKHLGAAQEIICRTMSTRKTLPDVQDLLEPFEEAISQVLIPAIVGRKCSKLDRDVLALPVRLGGLSLSNPCHEAAREHASSIHAGRQVVKRGKGEELSEIADNLKQIVSRKTKRALELAQEKGSSVLVKVLPLQEHSFNLSKREFRDAFNIRYDWSFDDIPSYSQDFGIIPKESLKTVTKWAAKYFTHEKSYHPVPQTSTEFADVNFYATSNFRRDQPETESAMKEFLEKYGPLRLRTVREDSTKDRGRGGFTTGRLHDATRLH